MSLVKTGSGTWNLSGGNTYTGNDGGQRGTAFYLGPKWKHRAVDRVDRQRRDPATGRLGAGTRFRQQPLGSQPITLQGGVLQLNLGNVNGCTETMGSVRRRWAKTRWPWRLPRVAAC